MSFEGNVRILQRALHGAGYTIVREPVDLSILDQEDRVIDCEIIARKDFFNIMYMEAESKWRRIASKIAGKSRYPCLLITRYADTHHILTTVKDHGTRNAKPYYVVLETGARLSILYEFIKCIKADPHDDHIVIDKKVQSCVGKFSEYKQAVDEFGKNLGAIIKKTESDMRKAISGNKKYEAEAEKLLKMCRDIISGEMDLADIKSMLMQHILTYRIFALVYDVTDFHETNAVAKSLEDLKKTLDFHDEKISYKTMELIAESVTDTDQRQEFLKKVYETFYEKYDPDRADKDGIVYTPSEAVNFMVKSTDELLIKHFGKTLQDDGVTVLDPATGTGTFIVYIMRQIGKFRIKYKYANDLHANELSILPYYIAALNIEHAYKELTGEYKEFENICWMDTLDSGVKDYEKLTSYISTYANVKRMSKQQNARIHVTIGNPPYNAVQTSYNNANPADKYEHIDEKIWEKYYEDSTASNKNKAFDMYKRFLRWSSDRINGNGMVVFISNNSFLDAKADDGVRRALYDEFDYIYLVNMKGNARLSGEPRRQEAGNVFGGQARVGVCISFLIKTGKGHSEIQYAEVADYAKQEAKLEWLDKNTVLGLKHRQIVPDKDAIWLNQTDNDFESLCPVLPDKFRESIFKESTVGVTTAKDDWAYDFSLDSLSKKMKYYITTYNRMLQKHKNLKSKPKNLSKWVDKKIKWSTKTSDGLKRHIKLTYNKNRIVRALYRPFVRKFQYYDDVIIDRPRSFREYFYNGQQNILIGFPNPATNVKFDVLGTNVMTDLGCLNIIQNIPLWLYDQNGKKTTNVTKFALEMFKEHYKKEDVKITPECIFYYTYAIFNDPKYEEVYRHNLRRSLPQIPLAKDLVKWSSMGKKLFQLHCDFDDVEEFDLSRIDKTSTKNTPRLSFKKRGKNIRIVIDDQTTLDGIPHDVLEWTFKSRTPLECVLEFYKESKSRIKATSCNDKKTRDEFNTYQFKDHKEEVITLLRKITTVCVETVRIRRKLQGMEWGPQPDIGLTIVPKRPQSSKKCGKNKNKSSKARGVLKQEADQGDGQTRLPT